MKKITIVGGGLVGSLLSAYLAKRGHEVDVYERRQDLRKVSISAGRSINMACSTRGWKALDYIGVGDQIRASAIPMKGRMIHDEQGNLTFQPYGRKGQAIYSISRGGLNKILMDFAEKEMGARFHFNKKCTDIDLEQNVTHFLTANSNETTAVKSDLIFGADGAFSAVRQVLEKQNRFNFSQTYISHGYKELTIPPTSEGDFAMEPNALHIWPRGQYMLIALPNPDHSFTCTLFLPFEGKSSFENLLTKEDVFQFFQKTFKDALPLMPSLEEDFFNNPASSLCLIRCFPWTYKNQVALIGDAAHAIVPFYGQGMIAGFEACTVLEALMNKHGEDWETIFQEYELTQKPNADAIADLALHNFIIMRDKVADPSFLLKKQLERKLHDLFEDEFIPLYSMVSFSTIPYAEAQQKGKEQDELLDELMEIENLEEKLDSEEIVPLLTAAFENYKRLHGKPIDAQA